MAPVFDGSTQIAAGRVFDGSVPVAVYDGAELILARQGFTPAPSDFGPSYFVARPGATAVGPISHYTGGAIIENFYNHRLFERSLNIGTENTPWTINTITFSYARFAISVVDGANTPRWIDLRWTGNAGLSATTNTNTYVYMQGPPGGPETVVLRMSGSQLNRRNSGQIRFRGIGTGAIAPVSGELMQMIEHMSAGGQVLLAFQRDP